MNFISTATALSMPFKEKVSSLKSTTKATFIDTPEKVRVLCEVNRYSRYLKQDPGPGVTSNLAHPIELVSVMTDEIPYTTKLSYKEETLILVNLGTYFKGVSTINHYVSLLHYDNFISKYTPFNYEEFCRDHNKWQELNKLKGGCIEPEFNVYALSKACTTHNIRVVRNMKQVRSNPSGSDRFVMHHELEDEYDIERTKFFMEHNLKIIRYLQQGNQEPLRCAFSNHLVEGVTLPLEIIGDVKSNQFDLHHILVRGKKSVLKSGVDPAKILRKGFLDDEENKNSFIDLLGTVVASKSYHSTIHEIRDSGIEYYKQEYLPWVLRNESNFNKACDKYNLNLDYTTFYNGLKLSSLLDK